MIALFYLEEDWRGAREWAQCQKEMAAKGEILDLRTLCPPGNPKDDLSKVPIFAEAIAADTKQTRLSRLDGSLGSPDVNNLPPSAIYYKGQPVNLIAWQHYYKTLPEAHLSGPSGTPAQDVLKALGQIDSEWNETFGALQDPKAYWPLDYDRSFFPSYRPITRYLTICKVITIRTEAHLENNQSDLAERDYQLSFSLNETLVRNCNMICLLIFIGDRAVADGALWEGLHRHAWSLQQLQEMEAALENEQLLNLAQRAFRVERASGLQLFRIVEGSDSESFRRWKSVFGYRTWYLVHARPAGWWNQDKTAYVRRKQELIESIKPGAGTVTRLAPTLPLDDLQEIQFLAITPLSRIMNSAEGGLPGKVAEAETHRRLTIIACRLEEYYLAHKEYPDALSDLADLPPHLNEEVVTSRPMHYGRKGASYFLYSTGWDGKDRGGTPRGPRTGDNYDWVWPGP